MCDQYEAVKALLLSVYDEGLAWYRNAKSTDLKLFDRRTSGSYSIFEGREIHNVGSKPNGSFPSKKILIMHPSGKEEEAVLGLWVRWNFEADPFEFRIFLGQWSQIEGKRTFVAFRFEAPEQGHEHDYWHCQPCRNFGEKENVPDAALISHRFPTIPVNASNIVELTICALMASMGRKKAKTFVQKLLQDPAATSGGHLKSAYLRCCL